MVPFDGYSVIRLLVLTTRVCLSEKKPALSSWEESQGWTRLEDQGWLGQRPRLHHPQAYHGDYDSLRSQVFAITAYFGVRLLPGFPEIPDDAIVGMENPTYSPRVTVPTVNLHEPMLVWNNPIG